MNAILLLSRRLAVLFLLLVVVSCDKDDDKDPQHAKVNQWILDNMEFWYLWDDQIPQDPNRNLDPEAFFKSLLSNEDRFSWIQDNYQELLNSLQGVSKEAGYEFVLYRESEGSSNVIAQILYTKPGSPAEQAGLKRGDLISHVNDQQLTTGNYQELIAQLHENHTLRYRPLLLEQATFDEPKSTSLNVVEYAENPNYLSRVIEAGGKKIGYYVYNFFATGRDGATNAYEAGMESIFAGFKAAGIQELVLDLRFNSGGSETAAVSLASFIGAGIDETKTFARREYNEQVEQDIINDPKYGPSFLITRFQQKAANIGSQLTGNRVYILTSSRTASASELVINALRPFMEVFLIGDVTYGKNVGSITIFEENNPANLWGMQPIVVKVYNSLDQSEYGNGFTPDILHEDTGLYLYPLGDAREALLAQAIGHITGTLTTGRSGQVKEHRALIGHSLDEKRRSFNLIIDQNTVPVFDR